MKKNLLLVDDHPVFRKGLYFLLEDEEDMLVVGEAGDGKTALDLVEELSPDIVVMDVTMPGFNGIEATKRIVADFPGTLVVALSIHSEKQFVQDMLQAGASGYILNLSSRAQNKTSHNFKTLGLFVFVVWHYIFYFCNNCSFDRISGMTFHTQH